MKNLRFGLWLLTLLLLASCVSTLRIPAAPVTDLKPTVLLVSFDGFRWDYFDKQPTPNLHKVIHNGVHAKGLIPIFPSVTFPNHYTIVTGLYAEHHGIVGNAMFDPTTGHHFDLDHPQIVDSSEWWGGEPLWVTARKQDQVSASMFWVGSSAEIGGVRPNFWKPYDPKVSHDEKINQTLAWLDLPVDKRPTFLTLYFQDTDSAGHAFGPESAEVKEAITKLDQATGRLLAGLEERGIADKINLIFVSDHGMIDVPAGQTIDLSKYVDLAALNAVNGGAFLEIFPPKQEEAKVFQALAKAHPHMHVYRKSEIPAAYHYRNNPRIAPILCVADEGWYIDTKGGKKPHSVGAHGYDPKSSNMHGIFIAQGPAFKKGYERREVKNIHLYELMAHILSLKPAANDGKLSEISDVLGNVQEHVTSRK